MYVNETQRVSELIEEAHENVEALYNNVDELITGIEELKTSNFIKRLICRYFPNEKVFDNVMFSDIDDLNEVPISAYIRCLRKAVVSNAIPKKIVITKDISYNIALPKKDDTITYQNGLIRDWFGSGDNSREEQSMRKDEHRLKLFALGFILNLTIDDFMKLLLQECGQANINYKDPYEVLFIYCLSKHTNVYETYTKLREDFENKEYSKVQAQGDTIYYKNQFELLMKKDPSDEDIIGYLLSLPQIKSETYNKCFIKLYNKVKDEYNDILIEDDRITQLIRKNNFTDGEYITDSKFIREVFGSENERRIEGNLEFIKSRVSFDKNSYSAIINGDVQASRDEIVFLLFIDFAIDKFGDAEDEYEENPNGRNKIKYIYNVFCEYCNDVLENIGAMELYLPNPVERVLVYCLMTNEPLMTMKKLFIG